jgi:MFS family permease
VTAGKGQSLVLLLIAVFGAMSLWFVSAAILPGMMAETPISPFNQAALSSAVQLGFVVGALASAILGLADRYDPRRVLGMAAVLAGLANLALLLSTPGSPAAIVARGLTGALLAGVYPVGMKIAVGWGERDRGFIVGSFVGALILGSAAPHLFALAGGTDWRPTVVIASLAAILGGLLAQLVGLGPHHAQATRFDPRAVVTAWTNRRVRLAYAGYFGHMWELYAMWAWVAVIAALSYGRHMPEDRAVAFAAVTAFISIAAGAVTSMIAGRRADRIGKASVALAAMAVSGICALLAALTFGGPVWLTFIVIVMWGASISPDSAQFSALVADNAPPHQAGSLMTLQTALGFALTFVTVQATPVLAEIWGWPALMALMALGPVFGIYAMARLRALA